MSFQSMDGDIFQVSLDLLAKVSPVIKGMVDPPSAEADSIPEDFSASQIGRKAEEEICSSLAGEGTLLEPILLPDSSAQLVPFMKWLHYQREEWVKPG
jgi:hypothetical protein